MADVEIGIGKSGRRAYGFDDIAIVPSRRTRDPEDVDISWEIDAFRFDLPLMAAAMDGVTSPATAIEVGRLGGLAALNLEGLWTRYEDPDPLFEEIATLDNDKATARMQQIYAEPIDPELITERIREIKEAGVVSCASLTPQRTELYAKAVLEAELDLLVIQGTVVSAEHVSKTVEPLNLKRFIREFEIPVIVGGCASYQAALHLMRSYSVISTCPSWLPTISGLNSWGWSGTQTAALALGRVKAVSELLIRATRSRCIWRNGDRVRTSPQWKPIPIPAR